MGFRDALGNRFVVTVELNPPKGTNLDRAVAQLEALRNKVDAINITDNYMAKVRLSAIATAHLIQERLKMDTIFNLTCRDKNIIGLQSDLLGAWALGLENVLVITGDPPEAGDHPSARGVFELNSLGLVRLIKRLNDGYDASGKALNGPPSFCIGVATNPSAMDREREVDRLREKVEAGATFALTQPVYDKGPLLGFLERIRDLPVHLIMGLLPLKSYAFARHLQENVPGIYIPDEAMARMASAGEGAGASAMEKREGLKIVLDLLREVRPVLEGVHIMPTGDFKMVLEIVEYIASLNTNS